MPILPSLVLPKNILTALLRPSPGIHVSPLLLETATADPAQALDKLRTTANGLSEEEAQKRLEEHGPNVVAQERRHGKLLLLGKALINPLVILLLILSAVSFLTGDVRAGTVMSMMVVLGVVLRFVQESRADTAAAKLKAMISVTATVIRDGMVREAPLADLVPGDVVKLCGGRHDPGGSAD